MNWTLILTIGLQVVGWILNRATDNQATKEAFFEFVKKAGTDLGSVKLMQYGDEQLKWFKENPWQEST